MHEDGGPWQCVKRRSHVLFQRALDARNMRGIRSGLQRFEDEHELFTIAYTSPYDVATWSFDRLRLHVGTIAYALFGATDPQFALRVATMNRRCVNYETAWMAMEQCARPEDVQSIYGLCFVPHEFSKEMLAPALVRGPAFCRMLASYTTAPMPMCCYYLTRSAKKTMTLENFQALCGPGPEYDKPVMSEVVLQSPELADWAWTNRPPFIPLKEWSKWCPETHARFDVRADLCCLRFCVMDPGVDSEVYARGPQGAATLSPYMREVVACHARWSPIRATWIAAVVGRW